MSLEALIIQRISELTALFNEMQSNAKNTEDFPEQTILVPSSKLRVSNNGVSESIEIQKIIDASIQDGGLATPPIEPPDYANISEMLANQANQTPDYIQYVIDASADPNVTPSDPNKNRFYRYLGTTNTNISDYQMLSNTQSEAIINLDNKLERGGYDGTAQNIVNMIPSSFDVDWPNIQGDQSAVNLSGFNNDIDYATNANLANKVDKEAGKGLSDENYTLGEKQKLAGLEGSKWLGLYPNLTALETAHPTALAGNYADVDAGVGVDTIRYVWDVSDEKFIESGSGEPLTPAQIKQMYESNPDTNAYNDIEKAKVTANTDKVTNATHTGEVTGSGVLTITNKAVTDAKLADVPTMTLKGRNAAGTGVLKNLSIAEVKAMLGLEEFTTQEISSGGNYNNLEVTANLLVFTNENSQAIINGIYGKKEFHILNLSSQYEVRINHNSPSVSGDGLPIMLPTSVGFMGVRGTARVLFTDDYGYFVSDTWGSLYRPEYDVEEEVVMTVNENNRAGSKSIVELKVFRDAQAAPMTKIDLNTAYPAALRGFEVICKLINTSYLKVDNNTNDWVAITNTNVV